jgi:hypothetical protein
MALVGLGLAAVALAVMVISLNAEEGAVHEASEAVAVVEVVDKHGKIVRVKEETRYVNKKGAYPEFHTKATGFFSRRRAAAGSQERTGKAFDDLFNKYFKDPKISLEPGLSSLKKDGIPVKNAMAHQPKAKPTVIVANPSPQTVKVMKDIKPLKKIPKKLPTKVATRDAKAKKISKVSKANAAKEPKKAVQAKKAGPVSKASETKAAHPSSIGKSTVKPTVVSQPVTKKAARPPDEDEFLSTGKKLGKVEVGEPVRVDPLPKTGKDIPEEPQLRRSPTVTVTKPHKMPRPPEDEKETEDSEEKDQATEPKMTAKEKKRLVSSMKPPKKENKEPKKKKTEQKTPYSDKNPPEKGPWTGGNSDYGMNGPWTQKDDAPWSGGGALPFMMEQLMPESDIPPWALHKEEPEWTSEDDTADKTEKLLTVDATQGSTEKLVLVAAKKCAKRKLVQQSMCRKAKADADEDCNSTPSSCKTGYRFAKKHCDDTAKATFKACFKDWKGAKNGVPPK